MRPGRLIIHRIVIHVRPRRFVLWLLPLLMWQLLLPPGVMPGSGAQGATLVLCSMHHAPMGAMAPAADQRDHLPAGKRSSGICPFAAVGAAAPIAALEMTLRHDVVRDFAALPSDAQRSAGSGPIRTQLSRAPPTFS